MSNQLIKKEPEQLTPTNPQKMNSLPFSMESWYESLVEDCRAIVVEGEFTARWALVETYHELGNRIIEEYSNVEKIGVDKFIGGVAQDIKKSKRTVYYALKFAQTYPDLQLLPEGKNTSWRKIVHEHLGEKKLEPKPKMSTCPNCGHEYEI